ncbi:MAG: NAD-binding protein [candidate division NC10 bacterium]|nr:NAD-binding protein [candidate division NC10 bacterium]
MTDTRSLGFIGIGVMGGPMTRNLLKAGYPVFVFDTDHHKMAHLVQEGAKGTSSPAEVGRQAEIVLLSLPSTQAVKEVILGKGGLVEGIRTGGTIVDMGTTDPSVTKEIAKILREKGIGFLDAPVSGGEAAAKEKTLAIMVGGDADALENALPVLKSLGRSIVHMGPSGAGQAAKLINNMIVNATFTAVAEGFALGAKAGLDPAELYEAIKGGWAGSKVLDVAAPAVLSRNFQPGGTVDIVCKDLSYALALGRDLNVPLPMAALVHEIFRMAKAMGKGPLAQPVLITLWENWTGITVGGQE